MDGALLRVGLQPQEVAELDRARDDAVEEVDRRDLVALGADAREDADRGRVVEERRVAEREADRLDVVLRDRDRACACVRVRACVWSGTRMGSVPVSGTGFGSSFSGS
jgi:hypothetical protein